MPGATCLPAPVCRLGTEAGEGRAPGDGRFGGLCATESMLSFCFRLQWDNGPEGVVTMAQKTVWITWAEAAAPEAVPEAVPAAAPEAADGPAPQAARAALQVAAQSLASAGFEVSGAPWHDAGPEAVAWSEVATALMAEPGPDVWAICADAASLANPSFRFEMSLAAAAARAARGSNLKIVVAARAAPEDVPDLPPLLSGAAVVDGRSPAWGAKALAATFKSQAQPDLGLRLNAIGHKLVGQWIEVGPAQGTWPGIALGADNDATLEVHAVGPAGSLPERTVLEYPTAGIKGEIGGRNFTLNAVQNELDAGHSYFVKVSGRPTALVVAETGDDIAEVRIIALS